MDTAEMRAGTLVEYPEKPEWGPGKIAHVREDLVYVFFRDNPSQDARRYRVHQLRLAESQSDAVLDNYPPFIEKGGTFSLPAAPVSLLDARNRFLRHYPLGFSDPAYLGSATEGERNYKWIAHERCAAAFGNGRGRALLASGQAIDTAKEFVRVIGGAHNLLARTEWIAFQEGLRDESAARRYLNSLFDLAESGPTETLFGAHADAVGRLPAKGATHTDKWTVATLGPFLMAPRTFMFVKPQNTKAAAAALAFDIKYDTRPNWRTYDAVVRMAELYLQRLADMGPRDFIDIQSFFWVTGDTFEQTLAAHKAKRRMKDEGNGSAES
jgi:hypothetical protein